MGQRHLVRAQKRTQHGDIPFDTTHRTAAGKGARGADRDYVCI